MTTTVPPTIHALLLDGKGGARPLDPDELARWTPADGALWLHLLRTDERTESWIHDQAGLDPIIADALLAPNSRPRVVQTDEGLLAALRGVNLNENADPEDMVSLRIWFDQHRMITLRREKLMTVEDVAIELREGRGPDSLGALFARLSYRMLQRMDPVIAVASDELDELEDWIVDPERGMPAREVLAARRQLISLRKYIAPQKSALSDAAENGPRILDDDDRTLLAEATNRATRYIEDLDALRERATLLQDQIQSAQAELLGRRTYLLTVVAAVVLPLSLLTGLLGINVGGIPLADSPWGFPIVCAGMVAIGIVLIVALRRVQWM